VPDPVADPGPEPPEADPVPPETPSAGSPSPLTGVPLLHKATHSVLKAVLTLPRYELKWSEAYGNLNLPHLMPLLTQLLTQLLTPI